MMKEMLVGSLALSLYPIAEVSQQPPDRFGESPQCVQSQKKRLSALEDYVQACFRDLKGVRGSKRFLDPNCRDEKIVHELARAENQRACPITSLPKEF